jgi:hypothetical protein
MEPIDDEPIIGVIFPLPERVIKFMFENSRDVYVKYTTHGHLQKSKLKLEKGMNIYFYQSGSNKIIVGEGKIEHTEFLSMDQILEKYANRLLTTEDELKDYSKGREDKRALVIEFTNLIKYEEEIKLLVPITMAGLYLTEKRKSTLFID